MGRKAHITEEKFSEFIEAVPENAVADGYWKIKKENINKTSGGVIQSIIGYMPFEDSESYDQLRERILDLFVSKHGPAVYYAVPCDERKKEVQGQGLVKLEFKENEVDMPEKDAAASPMEQMKHLKRMQKDQLDMQSLEMQRGWMEKMMNKSDKEEEEVTVPEGNSMSDMMMWKMLSEDGGKASKSDHLLERMMEKQADSDRRIESLIEKMSSGGQENAMQGMMAMMVKQSEERDRVRQEEERRRYDESKEDRRRQEELTRTEKERFERTISEERRRYDAENLIRREEMKIEEEKTRRHGVEQQKFQLQLLDIFKNNRESSLDSTTKIVESLTSAGLTSMNTAQKAAESIMDIASRANPEKDKDEGIGSVIRDVGQMALPLLQGNNDTQAPQNNPLAQLQEQQQAQAQPTPEQIHAYRAAQERAYMEAQKEKQAKERKATVKKPSASAQVIGQIFDTYPVFRPAMFGSLEDGNGADLFVPMLLQLKNDQLNWFLANTSHLTVMDALKEISNEKEVALVNENEEWFKEVKSFFQDHLDTSLYGPSEDDQEDGPKESLEDDSQIEVKEEVKEEETSHEPSVSVE
jgi:hypothetical protein